ncbi:uncharacterized protein [Palaemon carinicauda]|uniref:uncharacterized protein n=1 Tax=Palaemon carinicauda TaxID=392227 RepID=UPI0035B61FDB
MVIQYYHEHSNHMGLMHVLSLMREKVWVIKGHAAVRRVLSRCVRCRRAHGKVIEQLMADLPLDRVESGKTPFYRTGVDLFGPFFVKRGRAQIKHWGVIFTCLNMRAIHLEVASNLRSDKILSVFRRFLARCGQVKTVRCDCGTNIVGSWKFLDSSYEFLAGNKVRNELLGCCDIAIGGHSKQRWKQVKHMSEQFWARWKREFLLGLQQRQKWFKERRNVRVGDVVLMVKENEARCHWPE